ncbi:MAG: trigger factor [Cyclobacteriaceae bacterium]
MNITLDKKNDTDGLIKITLSESDYQPKVQQKIKDYARKANIKGFRQGKVPSGVIKKMFGKSILVEEVNHLISHSVSNYIKENKLRILGDPMPNQGKANLIDWDSQKDFEFEFQIGMVEDFKYDLSSKVKLKSYPIKVEDKVIDETLADLKKRFGDVSHPETSDVNDTLHGELHTESSEPKSAHIEIKKLKSKAQKQFLGKKKDEEVEFDINEVYDAVEDKGILLGLSPEESQTKSGKYFFKINTINRVAPAEVNQELFDKVFGKDAVKSEEEFIAKIRETISENYDKETEHLLNHEIQHHFVEKTKIALPDDFLKQWLKSTGEGKITDEVLEKEFEDYKKSIKWDLIKNKISEDLKINVEAAEVKEKAKEMIMQQFGGQAFAAQLGDKLDGIADNYLSDQEGKNFMKLYDQLKGEKIIKTIRESITIDEKPVGMEEFKEIVEKHQH